MLTFMKLFLLTLIPPALWAVANHVDKFLVSRYFKDASLGAMMVFSSLIGVLVLPVAFFLQDQAFAVGFLTPMIIVLNGCLYLVGVQLYLMGLRVSDASTAVPILQMTPVLSFFLAYIVLGETLSSNQQMVTWFCSIGVLALSSKRFISFNRRYSCVKTPKLDCPLTGRD
jgi:drug/metabolite transporter (DMT)-like permease